MRTCEDLFVDADATGFVLRARHLARHLLERSAPELGATGAGGGEWHVAASRAPRVHALCAELHPVVLPRAAAALGAPAPAPRVLPELTPEPLWGRVSPEGLGVTGLLDDTLARAAARCDACGQVAASAEVVFRYDLHTPESGTAVAVATTTRCEPCALLAHHGRARMLDLEEVAFESAERVNGWERATTTARFRDDARTWGARSDAVWDVDLSALARP